MGQRTRRNGGRNPAMTQRLPADAPAKLQQPPTGPRLALQKPVVNPYGVDTDVNVNPEACMAQTSIFNHPMGTRLYRPPELNHVFRPDLAFPPGIHYTAVWQQVQQVQPVPQVPYIPNQQAWAHLADPSAVWVPPQAVPKMPKKVWQSTPERRSGWPVDQPAFLVVPEPQKCPPGCPPELPVPPPPQPHVPPPPQPPSTGENPGAGDAAAARAARRRRRKADRAPSVPVRKAPAKTVQPFPVDENGVEKLPSRGSEGHAQKKCRPCHYIHTKAGCSNGEDCGFCHMKHSKRSRPRLPKQECLKCRNIAQLVFQEHDEVKQMAASVQMLVMMNGNPRLAAYASSVLRSLRGGAKLRMDRSKAGALETAPEIVELIRQLEQRGEEDEESDEEGGSEEEEEEEEDDDYDDEEGEEEASENASREEEASSGE